MKKKNKRKDKACWAKSSRSGPSPPSHPIGPTGHPRAVCPCGPWTPSQWRVDHPCQPRTAWTPLAALAWSRWQVGPLRHLLLTIRAISTAVVWVTSVRFISPTKSSQQNTNPPPRDLASTSTPLVFLARTLPLEYKSRASRPPHPPNPMRQAKVTRGLTPLHCQKGEVSWPPLITPGMIFQPQWVVWVRREITTKLWMDVRGRGINWN
jgi:hypothetical protein